MRKQITGFEGLYEVDESGNVYSVRNGIILRPIKMQSGYYYVHLCNGKKSKLARLHRIVAKAFIPNPDNLEQINHINGDKSDNRAENLEWCDLQYNMEHAIQTGLFKTKGEDNPASKLTKCEVEAIRKEYVYRSKEHGTYALGEKYGVTNVMISKIVTGKCWKDGFSKDRSVNRDKD